MSDIDPTPGTPVTIGDRLGWWRGDVAARLTTLENRVAALAGTPASSLAALKTDLTLATEHLSELRSAITNLRGVDQRNLSQIYTALYDGLFIQGDVANYPAHIRLNAELESISERMDALQAGVGAQPYESLELASVRGLLNALLTNASAATYGLAPITRANDVSSDGEAYVDGRLYAMFAEAPSPAITLGTNGFSLTGDWSGWSCYIQTADPQPLENNNSAPANRWYTLVGNETKNWSVQQRYTIRVTLRPPPSSGTFVDFVSVFVTLNAASSPRPAVVWGTSTPYQTSNNSGGGTTWGENVVLLGNFNGAVITCNANSANWLRIAWRRVGATTNSSANVSQGNSFTITQDTSWIFIDNLSVRTVQFSGRIVFP